MVEHLDEVGVTACVVIGGGGHALVVIEAMQLEGRFTPVAIVDADPASCPQDILGVPVRGDDSTLPALIEEGATRFVVAVGAIGRPQVRRSLFESASAAGLTPATVTHPGAIVSAHATVGAGSQILAGAVVNARTRLGSNVIVNTGAILEHDCQIGDHVHIAPGSAVAGGVAIGAGSHVGIGSSVKEGVTIGASVVVGAGAAVVSDVDDGLVVTGVPARPSGS